MSRMLGLAVVLVLVVAAPASAQSPTTDGYGGAAGVLGEVASGNTTPPTSGAPTDGAPGTDTVGAAGVTESGGDAPASGTAGVAAGGDAPASGTAGVTANGGSVSGDAPFATKPIATAGSLPFTGLDIGFLAAGSILLVALGFGLRKYGGRTSPVA